MTRWFTPPAIRARASCAQLYEWLKPRAVIPMHGEPRHLREPGEACAGRGIAETVLADNGQI